MTTVENRPRRGRRQRTILWTHVAFVAAMAIGCSPPATPQRAETPAVVAGVVTIEFKVDPSVDGSPRLVPVEVPGAAGGETLESVLRRVDSPAFAIRGRGPSAFVESIGGVHPKAGEGWLFDIDGQFSLQGVGTTRLVPPCVVTWRLGGFEAAGEEGS